MARTLAIALALGAVVVVLRSTGLLEGWAALLTAVVAVLAIPTSRSLSRRVLIAGCLFFGWVPMLWWVPLPVGPLGRATLLLAATVALTSAWIAAADRPTERLRRLLPRLRWIDALPPLAAAAAAVVLLPWLTVRDGAAALTVLIKGWDNVAHVNIVLMIRANGVTVPNLPAPPDGTAWAYFNYPQSFHANAATLVELMSSPVMGTPAQEVTRLMVVIGLINIALVFLLAAGICALPWLRSRPFVALPAVIVMFSLIVLGPGAASLGFGFTPFVLASALVCTGWLTAITMPRVAMPLQVAAVGGSVVGVAHNWAPMLVMAIPAVAALAFPLRRRRWSAGRLQWILTAVLVVLTAFGVATAFHILRSLNAGEISTRPGGLELPPLGLTLTLAFVAMAMCLAAFRLRRVRHNGTPPDGKRHDDAGVRLAWLAVVPVFGLVLSAILVAKNLAIDQELTYYFWKFLTGVEIVSVVLIAAAATTLIAMLIPVERTRIGRAATIATSILVALGMTQVFGYAGPWPWPDTKNSVSAGSRLAAQTKGLLEGPTGAAANLLAGAVVRPAQPGQRIVFIPIVPGDVVQPDLGYRWHMVLSQTWTTRADTLDLGIPPILGASQGAAKATSVLMTYPDAVVLIRPDELSAVRSLVAPELRERIITW